MGQGEKGMACDPAPEAPGGSSGLAEGRPDSVQLRQLPRIRRGAHCRQEGEMSRVHFEKCHTQSW